MGTNSDARPGGRRESAPTRMIDLAEQSAAGPSAVDDDRVRVLIVEDDPLFTELVTSILSEAGDRFEVIAVERLSAALATLVRDGVGLIIADLNLPDSAGPVTIGFLRRVSPDVPIIVLSGVDDVQTALEAIREGADEYVVKGRFSVDSLVWLVRLVLERHRRVAVALRAGTLERPGDVENVAALGVVGRHLIHVADRTGLHLGAVVLAVKAAPRGPWADREQLLMWVCDLLRDTLRRCDVVSRTSRTEMVVVLVSDGPLAGAVGRLRAAIVDGGAGPYVKVGFAAHDSAHPAGLDDLLRAARRNAHPVLA